jgi:hypothetical protein
LAEAAETLGLTRVVLERARDRDPNFPESTGYAPPGQPVRYWLADLETWMQNRPRVVQEGDD